MKYQTLVVRGDQSTVAIVKADVGVMLINDTAFFAAIVRAVTEWVKYTEEGKEAWERSSNDFNIGDLSGELGGSLLNYLSKQGIENLDITTFSTTNGNRVWTYDTLLVDSGELENEQS